MVMDSNTMLGAALAGGRSRRMGRDKAIVELAGRPLVQAAVDKLEENFSDVVVLSTQRWDSPPADVEIVPDLEPGLGPLAGLASALEHGHGRAVFILACDLPFVPSKLIQLLVETRKSACSVSKPMAVVPRWRGELEPLCAIYDSEILPAVRAALLERALGVQELLRTVPIKIVEVDANLSFVHPHIFMNLNRPEDLKKATDLVTDRMEPS